MPIQKVEFLNIKISSFRLLFIFLFVSLRYSMRNTFSESTKKVSQNYQIIKIIFN